MSHQDFAKVWIQLEKRTDIDNILRELIGQHALETSTLGHDSERLLTSSLHLAVYMKTIFDLQRLYALHPESSRLSSHLLRPKQLLLAIIYLIKLKSGLLRHSQASTADATPQYEEYRSFMAQALVSGLRALLLRKYQMSPDERNHLRQAFEESWGSDRDVAFDDFLIRTLCPKMLDELCSPLSDLSSPACGEGTLRDYDTGLYPLESRPNELTKVVQESVFNLQPKRKNWFRSYWAIFDIAWVTEAALIQLCVNSAKQRNNVKVASPTADDIKHLRITQKEIWKWIRSSPATTLDDWLKTVTNSISDIVLTQCHSNDCKCSIALSTQLSRQTSTIGKAGSSRSHRNEKPITSNESTLSRSLTSFTAILKSRKEELRDCNGELRDLSESLDNYLEEWYPPTSSLSRVDFGSSQLRRAAYIIPCDKLHPISENVLKGLIGSSPGKTGMEELNDRSSLLDVSISCPECLYEGRVFKARRIKPLDQISDAIEEKIQRKSSISHGLSPPQWFQAHEYSISLERPSSSSNSTHHSTVSSNTSLSDKTAIKTSGKLLDFFSKTPKSVSYSFSANGQAILLWVRYSDHIVWYDIRSGQPKKFEVVSPVFVAAGATLYAVVSGRSDRRYLSIYQATDGLLAIELPIEETVYSIAVSKNDEFVALGFATKVLILKTDDRTTYIHTLPLLTNPMVGTQRSVTNPRVNSQELSASQSPKVDSQRVCFSTESKKFIVATRYSVVGNSGRHIHVCVGECLDVVMNQDNQTLKIPTTIGNDFGLSSTFYDDKSGCAYITSFTSRDHASILVPKNKTHTGYFLNSSLHQDLGPQIQCATLSPSGLKFILVNERNEIFSVRTDSLATRSLQIQKINPLKSMRKPINAKEHMLAMAMPDEETLHLFWIKGGEWTLVSIGAS